MDPEVLGKKYDKIGAWWHRHHEHSRYGMDQIERALRYRGDDQAGGTALDVGCGSGGRVINALTAHGYAVTGVDVSAEMIRLARKHHPDTTLVHADICQWQSDERFDVIVGWDSIFHVPLSEQRQVVTKLCELLNQGGVLIYTFGNAVGESTDTWRDDTFYYSSIGIDENVRTLMANECSVLHLERDQFPERHVYVVAQKH